MKRFNIAGFIGLLAIMVGLLAAAYIAGAASASTGSDSPRGLPGLLQSFVGSGGNSGGNLVDRAMERLKDEYFMEISPEEETKLRYAAVQGMLNALRAEPYKDDYSNFFDPDFYKELSAQTEGHYAGIGVLMGVDQQYPYPRVEQVFEGSPAAAKGLEKDDIIVSVDGEDTRNMILPEVASKIKGEPGTPVKLELIRPASGELLKIDLVRSEVTYKSIQDVHMLEGGVGYIKLTTFAEKTADDFRDAMEDLSAKGMKSLIIDLRDNSGGLLEAAVGVADCFIDEGMIVEVAIRSKNHQTEKLFANPNSKKYKLPVVVMVNAGSASSSEVLTSALRDYGVARVFGDRTFGKGVVQAVTPMEWEGPNIKSALSVTIGKYYTKSKTEIHGSGLEPDLWYNFQNELGDDPRLQAYDNRLKELQKQMNDVRGEAAKYIRDKDVSLSKATAIAEKLGRGDVVANMPEVKPKEDDSSPFDLLAGRSRHDEEKEEETPQPPAEGVDPAGESDKAPAGGQ
ncbi:S41 family peptidase [bacterium]|nr:S41 family peptidase [bacterium]